MKHFILQKAGVRGMKWKHHKDPVDALQEKMLARYKKVAAYPTWQAFHESQKGRTFKDFIGRTETIGDAPHHQRVSRYMWEAARKRFSKSLELQKARSHKYIRRTGAPKQYHYIYREPYSKETSQAVLDITNRSMEQLGIKTGKTFKMEQGVTEKDRGTLFKVRYKKEGFKKPVSMTVRAISADHAKQLVAQHKGNPEIVDVKENLEGAGLKAKTFRMEGGEPKFGWEQIKKDPNSFYNKREMAGHDMAKETLDLAVTTLEPYIKTKAQKFLAENMLNYDANDWNYFAVHLSKKDIMITRMALRRVDKAMKEPGGLTGLLDRVQHRAGLWKSGLVHALEHLAYEYDQDAYMKGYKGGMAYLGLTGKAAEDRFHRYHDQLADKHFEGKTFKMEGEDMTAGSEVARTISQQMGGFGRIKAMTGAKNFLNLGRGLSFDFPNRRGPNHVKITLDPDDTYNVEFGRKPGMGAMMSGKVEYKKVSEHKGIYDDQLKELFEKETGLYLSL